MSILSIVAKIVVKMEALESVKSELLKLIAPASDSGAAAVDAPSLADLHAEIA